MRSQAAGSIMTEHLSCPERALWFDGANYTADGIVINPTSRRVLLIRRRTGEWALPGGFIDEGETPRAAAVREIAEETCVNLAQDDTGLLIYRGLVDDPRNDETAWIETSAYLFLVHDTQSPTAQDDALDAQWMLLDDLPPLYASHNDILARTLDYLEHQHLLSVATEADHYQPIEGGHMRYHKVIATKDESTVFVKQHEPAAYTDPVKSQRCQEYLAKEAVMLSHLRHYNFTSIPSQSVFCRDRRLLAMETLSPAQGWQWYAHSVSLDRYLKDAIEAFDRLAHIPPPADTFPIEPALHSMWREGWQALDPSRIALLKEKLPLFASKLHPSAQQAAEELMRLLPLLRHEHLQRQPSPSLVLCHHDIRQSNIAWHPKHGIKIVDWSWADLGEPGSDITSLLIDLHKSGHDVSAYQHLINPSHCLTLIGFWLGHATWPSHGDPDIRFQQFLSAVSAYELLVQHHSPTPLVSRYQPETPATSCHPASQRLPQRASSHHAAPPSLPARS